MEQQGNKRRGFGRLKEKRQILKIWKFIIKRRDNHHEYPHDRGYIAP